MKSKMKSTFAIIAVALMVLVAVVPMVGIFTENSVATTEVDPEIDGTITISGTIYKASGAAETAAGTNYVKVMFNSYTMKAPVTAAGGYSITIQETSVASVTLTYVDKDGTAVKDFNPITLTGLSIGTYTADFKAGNISGTATLKSKNAVVISDVVGKVITASYTAFTLSGETYTKVSDGSFNKDGTATIFYPYSANNYDLYVTVSGFSATGVSGTPITFAEKQKFSVSSGGTPMVLAANENIVKVGVSDANVLEEFTVTEMYKGTATEKVSFAKISDKIKYGVDTETVTNSVHAYFTTTADLSETVTMVLTAGNNSQATIAAVTLANTVDFAANLMVEAHTTTQMFFGTVKLGAYAQDGTLGITLDSSSVTSPKVDKDGNFLTFVPAEKKVKALSFQTTAGTFTSFTIDASAIPGAGYVISSTSPAAVAIQDDTYAPIVGNLYLVGTETGIADKELNVTATSGTVKIFGYKVTGANGAFGFMATKDINVTMKPTDYAKVAYTGDINFVVGTDSAALKIYMAKQDVSVAVSEALGRVIDDASAGKLSVKLTDGTSDIATLLYDGDDDVFTATIRGDVPLTSCKIYIANTSTLNPSGYTFANSTKATAIAYEKDKAYAAKEATYKLTFYKADGITKLTTVTTDNANVYTASAYKNTIGSIVYDDISAAIATATSGVFTFKVNTSYLDYTKATISTTPVNIAFVKTANSMSNLGIFEKYYVLTDDSVDDDGYGIISIVASTDSFSGKLTRIDGVTPIAGIKVQVSAGTTPAVVDTAYTQYDGSFTIYSAVELADVPTTTITFENAKDYTFTPAQLIYDDNGDRKDAFKAATDAYEFTYYDADGKEISLTGVTTTINTEEVDTSYAWEAGDKVDVAMTKGGVYRTFASYYLTEDDVASGEVAFVSEQSTYNIAVKDANGELRAATFAFQAQYDNTSYGALPAGIPTLTATATATDGKYTVLVTDLSNKSLVEKKVTGFAVKTTCATYGLDGTEIQDIEDEDTTVIAPYGVITYYVVDAAGLKLSAHTNPAETKIFKDGVQLTATAQVQTTAAGVDFLTFVNDPDAEYTVSVATTTGDNIYTFAKKQAPKLGFLFANEEWIYGNVVDAVGNVIGKNGAVINTYKADGTAYKDATYYKGVDGSYYKLLADVSEIAALHIADGQIPGYTFEMTDSLIIKANEQPVYFSAITANGFELDAVFDTPEAFDITGKKIGTALTVLGVDLGVIVDVDEVAYYRVADVNVVATEDYGYSFDEESVLPIFIANESYITGSVPWSGKDVQRYVELDYYLEGTLVYYEYIDEINKYEYDAAVDLSGMVINGVIFDTLVATYYEEGVSFGSAIIDPSSPVNNIISPIVEIYTAELLPPSALVASHVDIEQIGDVVTVTADANFMIADDEGVYTDGQYTYTFAGWYVNNQKVSTSPVYTFELTDNVVISPQYTVTYEKTSDANDKQTPQPTPVQPDNSIDTNVLIIGICAVIVALIAVVYAVIKKE